MAKIYRIPFAYERYGRIPVEADSPEEAMEIAREALEKMSVSDMEELSGYLEDSESIDEEGIILDENGNTV